MNDDTVTGTSGSDDFRPAGGHAVDPALQKEWDELYSAQDRVWSGDPNGALVAEAADLPPGRVLDVGCGEGADAVWLARRGWDVTALEVSAVALERAAAHARDAGVSPRWVHSGLVEARLPQASFDLVSAQYPALLRTSDGEAERVLLDLVAPGGVLLFVHHAFSEDHGEHGDHHDQGEEGHRFDHADFVQPPDVAALLDDRWEVEVNEHRPRAVAEHSSGAHHVEDVVLRARRLR
ncbi:class I SAM-dependent methyltransferase [Nocardiopsis algeriensis]|uniref:class I SAM-dependent methyltransferase n=1 Tax=Nocardiopsis algeriensis TaxID=1478215 RepID=UPI003B42CCFC